MAAASLEKARAQAAAAREISMAAGIGVDEDRTELIKMPEDEDRTEISDTSKGEVIERSMLRSLSDEEWCKAKEITVTTGKPLIIDERTDIYSTGATIYHFLTGVCPAPFFRSTSLFCSSMII